MNQYGDQEQVDIKIELPRNLPKKPELKLALGKFYDGCKNKQWFRRAEIIENHPLHMRTTLEIYCTYNPVLEMKDILQFAEINNLAIQVIAESNNG